MRLVPKTHMLKSIRSRNWNLAGAIQELVDNSLGHGQANDVLILIDNAKGIVVKDNGTGIDDINRVFTLGDASSHDKLSEIGQYGVGAKNATIYLGDVVAVNTVHDGKLHKKIVNWHKVETSGEWPEAYTGTGKPAKKEVGTSVMVTHLARHYQLKTSEKLADDLGQTFAPALRSGTSIQLFHYLANGEGQRIDVEPFTPLDMTDEIDIMGEVSTRRGVLRWIGRAGLSASLTERFNGVHIGFGHRIIEKTREPFAGESAPTLYVEISLDDTTPWKHSLSEHKDKIVRNRDELMASITDAIRPLLEKSAQQAHYLALEAMIAPIETQLTKALKGAGVLHTEAEETEGGGGGGDSDSDSDPKPKPTSDDGDAATAVDKPTGISIDFRDAEYLEGRLWSWEISGKQILVLLDVGYFKQIVGYPPQLRDVAAVQAIAHILAYALEAEHKQNPRGLTAVITPKLSAKITGWSADGKLIAPLLNRDILESARA